MKKINNLNNKNILFEMSSCNNIVYRDSDLTKNNSSDTEE
jgi:hypothetical protein